MGKSKTKNKQTKKGKHQGLLGSLPFYLEIGLWSQKAEILHSQKHL